MTQQASFPEEMDETEQAREENRDEWMDILQQKELDEGDVTESEIMPGDLELAEETLDDELLNENGMHIEEDDE
ncbi:MAG TPA: hypothetical protein VK003_06630 [Oceanobacillus sp.]|nr:hypothetical protein [Oceanobacillus sp.]